MNIVSKVSSLLNLPIIEKPKLYFEFYPLSFDKYITIYNEFSVPSNFYESFNDVIDDIKPYLDKHKIKIIQILNSESDPKIKDCFYVEKFSHPQLNYILKNSLLHICTDAYTNEISGILDIPILNIIGNRFPKSSKAFFSSNDKNHCIYKFYNKKPTFLFQENPKSINLIQTEEISEKILEIIGFKFEHKYKTLFVGSKYNEKAECDFVPNFELLDPIYSKFNLNVRLDKFFNEKNCFVFCSNHSHTIYTNKKLDNKFSSLTKHKCKKIIFMIDNKTEIDDVSSIFNLGINTELQCYENNFNKDLSFKFLDFGKINIIKSETSKEKQMSFKDMTFGTSKLILFNNKKYASYAHIEKDIQISTINKCIDSPLFWEGDCRYKIIGDNNDQIKP